MGFCEGLLALADANDVEADFTARAWEGAPKTVLSLRWK
jgi:hypothetical protein